MDDNTDIVDRLRSMYYELSRRQASTPFGERSELDGIPALLYEAAIKIQDLQGNEIDCQIEHGAQSNGHLEAVYNLFKEEADHNNNHFRTHHK
jgi:hypothetical protein